MSSFMKVLSVWHRVHRPLLSLLLLLDLVRMGKSYKILKTNEQHGTCQSADFLQPPLLPLVCLQEKHTQRPIFSLSDPGMGMAWEVPANRCSHRSNAYTQRRAGLTLKGEECIPQLFSFKSLREKSAITITIISILLMYMFL